MNFIQPADRYYGPPDHTQYNPDTPITLMQQFHEACLQYFGLIKEKDPNKSPRLPSLVSSSPKAHPRPKAKGVSHRNGKWIAQITVPGTRRMKYLGQYQTKEVALAAYNLARTFYYPQETPY